MARRFVTGPDGKRWNVDEKDVPSLTAKGYTVATEAENMPVTAALQSGVRGLSFGLSDHLLNEDQRAGAKQLQAENPKAAAIAGVAGQVAQTALLPEFKALGTTGNVLLQGGLAGIGPQVSEAALSNRPVSAELLAADVIAGAGTNLALHGVFTGAAKLAGKVAGKAGELAASERVTQAAESMQAGVMKRMLGLDDEAYKYAKANGLLAATDHMGVAELAGEAQRKAGAQAVEALDEALKIVPDLAPLKEEWIAAAKMGGKVANRRVGEIERELSKALKDVGAGSPDKFLHYSDDLGKAQAVYDAAIATAKKNPALAEGVAEAGIGAGIFGGPKAAAYAAGSKAINNAVAGKGGYLVNSALGKIAEGNVLPRVLEGFKAKIDNMLAVAPGLLGPFGAVLSRASAQGADALLATHTNLAKSEQGGDYLARLGMRQETPEETTAYGQKLAMLEAVEQKNAAFEQELNKNVKSFFKGEAAADEAMKPLTAKQLDARLKAFQQVLRDPSVMSGAIPTDVMSGAPALSMEGGQQATAIAQFLVDRAPKPQDLWKPPALRQEFEPSKADLGKWTRFVEAAENPRVVAAQMAAGRSSPEAVETMKTLYPNLFAALQQKVMGQLAELKKPLSYDKRSALANIFGPQILGQSPQVQMYLQSVHQASQLPPQGQEPGQGPSQDGRQMVNTNNNMQTQNQRLEGRK